MSVLLRAAPAALLCVALLCLTRAEAKTITVGEGKDFPLPSLAIRAAQDGDTILIDPGQYFDCAAFGQSNLTIAGAAPGAVITDKACMGKGLLVIGGRGTTVRDLTLARARVPDENGAGIRLEAPNLTVQRVTFENDQVGILSGGDGGTIRVEDSTFAEGGVGGDRPKYAIMVGDAALLSVRGSTFRDVKGGQVSTAANRTELVGNTVGNGAGEAPSVAVMAASGYLDARNNTFTLGPNPPRLGAAIAVMDDAAATIRDNRLVNQTGHRLALVLDWAYADPKLDGNTVPPDDSPETSAGLLRHRLSEHFHTAKDNARHYAGQVKHFLQGLRH